jgi:hypothetical protein
MTLIREAKQVSAVTDKPAESLYCILHAQMVKVQKSECGIGHELTTDGDYDFCCFEGGYAFTPPPDVDLFSEPELSEDERAQAELEEVGFWLGGAE